MNDSTIACPRCGGRPVGPRGAEHWSEECERLLVALTKITQVKFSGSSHEEVQRLARAARDNNLNGG